MNEAKKIRKAVKQKIGEVTDYLNKRLKPKPKYYPNWLWKLGARIYFKNVK